MSHQHSPGSPDNEDLAPTTRKGRTWHAYSIFTLWANDVHSLGNYVFAIGLFALGLGAWQIMLAFLLGAVLLFLLLNLSGFMGERTGVPFPVMSRIAFGIRGSNIPAIIRGAVAVAWFGIQTYLASVVLRVLILALAPSLAPLDTDSFLGLSTLGWISFVALWALQTVIVSFGMEMIRKYEASAGPIILVTMLALAVWMLVEAGGTIAWSTADSLTGPVMWVRIFQSAALWVVVYGTFVLNFCDFTRGAPSRRSVVRGNFFGIPINMLFFAAIVVVLAGAQYKIDGTVIESPTDNSPVVIVYFLGGLGALLGPLFGVIMADYWLVRKGRVNIPDLYSDSPDGEYAYTRGVNRKAVVAGTPAAIVALVLALVPAFTYVSGFSWFVGAILAAGTYLLIMDRHTPFHAVDGEDIAVAPRR